MRINRKSAITSMSMSVLYLILSASFCNVIVLSIDPVTAKQTTETVIPIHFSDPSLSTIQVNNMTFTQIQIKDCFMNGSIGGPLLPTYPVHVLVPNGAKIEGIHIQTSHPIEYSSQITNAPLFPCQDETPFSQSEKGTNFSLNQTTYTNKKPILTDKFTEKGIGTLRGYPILTIDLYPLEYIPESSELFFYKDMTITITWSKTNQRNPHAFYRGNKIDSSFVESFIDNPEELGTYDPQILSGSEQVIQGDSVLSDAYPNGLCDSSETVEYVIVTNNALADTTGYEYNWTDLLDHRQTLDGFSGRIVTIEDIDDCTDYWNATALFNDSAAHLREFCKDAYLDWNTQYILLGGSWQTSDSSKQIVPCRIMEDIYETLSYDTMPVDLYFSNLDGDWYDETYGVWGGGKGRENDKYAELSIGRLAVWNAEMISNSVDKIIWYDNCNDETFLRSAAFLGGDLGWTSTSKEYMEEIRVGDGAWAQYRGFEEWNTAYPTYAFDTTARYYDADYPTESEAVNAWKTAINNNEISLISHLDHGSWLNTLSLGTGSGLSNTHFFLGTSQACLSGRFTEGSSGASTFTSYWDDRGAFAMVINTGYGYGSSSSTYGASQQQHKIFWDYFFTNQSTEFSGWRLGDAMTYTKDIFSSVIDTSSHAYCYVWYGWHLFGDPAQTLRITISENNPPLLSEPVPSDGSINVSIDTSTLSITIADADEDGLNWTIQTSPEIGNDSGTDQGNGTKTCSISDLTYGSTYTWYVNVTDGTDWTREIYQFTVEDDPTNHAPVIIQASIANGSNDINLSVNFTVTITDSDNDDLNWTIFCSNGQNRSEALDNAGTKYLSLSSLGYNTSYFIWVNVTDGLNWTRQYIVFTTREMFIPSIVSDCQIMTINRTSIDLSWTKDSLTDTVRIERNTTASWSLGQGDIIENTSSTTFSDNDLLPGTTYYYQLWSWNSTDMVYSNTYVAISNTTLSNNLPGLSGFSVSNGSMNISVDVNWTATLLDSDGDELTWTMNSSNGQNKTDIFSGSGTVWMIFEDLSYNTTYTIWVNVTDAFDTIHYRYDFTTTIFVDVSAPTIDDITIEYSTAKDLLIGWENISCIITDASIINKVTVNISQPNGSFSNQSMVHIPGTDTYYYNTSLQQAGNYTYYIYAVDSNDLETFSNTQNISLAPNWDVNEDGTCNVLDLTLISNSYGQTGTLGWIRADVDNNGEIQVLDFVLSSNHYGEGWW